MLSVRLQAIADCVPEGKIVADVGTDHGFLPCELVKTGRTPRAYACDIAQGPLDHARKTLEENNLLQTVDLILTPGLEKVPADAEVAVIAGMGWMTAKEILENDLHRLPSLDLIIVQVNREVTSLRRWIMEHGFQITMERLVRDRYYYQIVCFRKAEAPVSYSPQELLFGPVLLKEKSPVFCDYYRYRKAKLERICRQIEDPDTQSGVCRQIEEIEAVL